MSVLQKDIGAGDEVGDAAGGFELRDSLSSRSWPRVLCKKCAESSCERTIALALAYGVIRDCDECGEAGASTVVTGRSPIGTMVVE